MEIKAQLVKELRERTNAGMMECKKALVAAEGDLDKAAVILRESGQSKADKKKDRITAEGQVQVAKSDKGAAILEVNCETDFVARQEQFKGFCQTAVQAALSENLNDITALSDKEIDGKSIEEIRKELIATIGENLSLRRVKTVTSGDNIGTYMHGGSDVTRIAAIIALEGGDEALANDLAMHMSAMNPKYLDSSEIPQDIVASEEEVLMNRARETNPSKPDNILANIAKGMMNKWFEEVCFMNQKFIKDPSQTIANLLKAKNAKILDHVRYGVGEGIEKKEENFAEEVMAQAQGK